jgi:predicted dinucleotide-binding enzyme
VVKAFNTVAAPVVAPAAAAPGRLSLLYCGDGGVPLMVEKEAGAGS